MKEQVGITGTATESTGEKGQTHSLWVVNRKEMTVKGVRDVVSFDENMVDLITSCGRMTLEGRGLRVTVLDTAGGVVSVAGILCGVLYEDTEDGRPSDGQSGKRGRLSRLFR
ncbi:MAG: YabP/YqfC family sporulation protein [Eubacteriales bacterium]